MTRATAATAAGSTSLRTVTKSSSTLMQRKCACGGSTGMNGRCEKCGKEPVRLRRSFVNQEQSDAWSPLVHEVLQSPGRQLDVATRGFMEPRFGYDFAGVRVHTEGRASAVARGSRARALTLGQDIVFGDSGEYKPSAPEGRRLLAHELSHTVQQRKAAIFQVSPIERSDPADPAEHEAERAADNIVAGRAVGSLSAAPPKIYFAPPDRENASDLFTGDIQLKACLNGKRVFRLHDTGMAVAKIQKALKAVGAPLKLPLPNAIFGPETKTSVEYFQRASAMPESLITGIVEKQTISKLDVALLSIGNLGTVPKEISRLTSDCLL